MGYHSSSCFCIIYALRNTVNDKIYVGQTWRALNVRWNTGYEGCTHLERAISAYGHKAFYYEILVVAHTQEIADYWETYFIHKYDTTNIERGYNLTSGGTKKRQVSLETRKKLAENSRGNTNRKGKSNSPEHRRKCSEALKGKKLSEEHKANISKGNLGKVMSREAVEKCAAKQRGQPKHSEEQKRKWSEMRRGMVSPAKGTKLSEETKKKKSEAMKGKTYKVINGKRVWSPKPQQ